MLLYAEKTKIVNISNFKDITVQNSITVDELKLETVENAKLLGIFINSHPTFKPHVTEGIRKVRKRLYKLIILKRNGLNKAFLLHLYTATMRPVVAYVAPAWYIMVDK